MVKERELVQQKQIDKSIWNKSVYFILPMIGITSSYYNLVNCFLGDNLNKPELNFNKIFVQLLEKDIKLERYTHYESTYKLDDNSYMYIFKIPKQFENDYTLFCDGKYSLFTDDYKDQIIKYIKERPYHNSPIYKILFKTLDQKELIEEMIGQPLLDHEEVCSRPYLDLELYDKEGG